MKVRFEMSMRNMLPGFLNELVRVTGEETLEESEFQIDLVAIVDWPAVPRQGETVAIGDSVFRDVRDVWWEWDGVVRVDLGDFDADELGDERFAYEYLSEHGWGPDLSGLNSYRPDDEEDAS